MRVWLRGIAQTAVHVAAQKEGLTGDRLKEAIGLVNIDAYSVHRSESFGQNFISYPTSKVALQAAAQKGQPMGREYVPAGCTGLYQIEDLVVNRPVKCYIQGKYTQFLIQHVQTEMGAGTPLEEIDLTFTNAQIAPYVLTWVLGAIKHCDETVNIKSALDSVGYTKCFEDMELRSRGAADLMASAGEYVPAFDEPGPEDQPDEGYVYDDAIDNAEGQEAYYEDAPP